MSAARSGAGFVERRRKGDDGRHGTTAGWGRHINADEPPCDACRAAKSEYDKRRLSSPEKAIRNRLHAKAQALAERDLRRLHPEDYRRFYLLHKEALLGEVVAEDAS